MIRNTALICMLLIGYSCIHAQINEENNQTQESIEPTESAEHSLKEEDKKNEKNAATQYNYSVEYVRNIKIKTVLLRLHSTDKTKALQYAYALAVQLQDSRNPIDQELYRSLCQYITLAYQYFAENYKEKATKEIDAQAEDSI